MSSNLDDLYPKLRHSLVRYATPILGSADLAEDAVQDVYLRLARNPDWGVGGWRAYLFAMVRNRALSLLRRRKLEQSLPKEDLPDWGVPRAEISGESQILLREGLEALRRALASLPRREREALEMHRIQGKTLQEVAAQLGVSTPTAHRLVRAGLVRLTEALAEGEVRDGA